MPQDEANQRTWLQKLTRRFQELVPFAAPTSIEPHQAEDVRRYMDSLVVTHSQHDFGVGFVELASVSAYEFIPNADRATDWLNSLRDDHWIFSLAADVGRQHETTHQVALQPPNLSMPAQQPQQAPAQRQDVTRQHKPKQTIDIDFEL